MATNVFNFGPVLDRVEANAQQLVVMQSLQAAAIQAIGKVLSDLVAALGGGDQPTIDAMTAALQSITDQLHAAAERDKG